MSTLLDTLIKCNETKSSFFSTFSIRFRLVFFGLILAFGKIASAEDYNPTNPYYQSPTYYDTYVYNIRATEILKKNHNILFPKTKPPTTTPGSQQLLKITPPVNSPSLQTINTLASAYPVALRPKAKQIFNALFMAYGQIVTKVGVPKNDLAGAVAAYIAGNYIAYRKVFLPDAHFRVLYMQLRRAMLSQPALKQLTIANKKMLYENLAIMGTFMAVTDYVLKRQPNPTVSLRLQKAAKMNLENLLGVNVIRVFIKANGLVIR